MPISVPPGEVAPGTKELRLAVVCYGGVSLAIYMHGVTRELHSLFRASEAFAADPSTNPWQGRSEYTERAYWQALEQAAREGEVATRVAVDIISGTSAGGINGVVLAKALSRGATQDNLRKVWLEEGSIGKLVNPLTGTTGGPLKRVKGALGTLWRARRGPLNGDFLLRKVYEALEGMDAAPASGDGVTVDPSPWPVELHVTLTDIAGLPQAAPAWDPKVIRDLRHGYKLVFRSQPPDGKDEFEREENRALAFAARATSSFPGAFPPARISDLDRLGDGWNGKEEFLSDYWAPYRLSDTDATKTQFMDGGVLDNAPFGLAITAVEERPATSQIDRKLLYIQPDPKDPKPQAGELKVGALKAVWGGLSTIPRREPVLNDLLQVRRRNERVRRARHVIAAAESGADSWREELPAVDELSAMDEELHLTIGNDVAAASAYRQIKLHTVVDRLALVTCEILEYPPESGHALFVKDVLSTWAEDRDILASPSEWERVQLPFLKAFDLGYRERRIRLVIDRINEAYAANPDPVLREHLDRLKQALYQRIWYLTALAGEIRSGEGAATVQQLFAPQVVRAYLDMEGDPEANVAAFVSAHGCSIDELQDTLGGFLTERLKDFTANTYGLLREMTESLPADLRREVLRRYVAFPRYDALLFPLRALSELGELDPVEVIRVSPLDARLLPVPGAKRHPATVADKLEGDAYAHFGAFLSRRKRETDYLWGRLDATERLISLVVGDRPSEAYKLAFQAVLDNEQAAGSLGKIPKLVASLKDTVQKLPKALAVGGGSMPRSGAPARVGGSR